MSISTMSNPSGLLPAGHRIVVCPIVKERTTSGGIVIPDAIMDREDMKQIEAEVIAVGPSAWADQAVSGQWCKVGDRVMIAKFAGLLHTGPDKKQYRIINDLDVVGVLEGAINE